MPPGGRSLRRWPSAAGPMAARCLSGADARRRSRERDVRVKDTRRNFSVRSPMIVLGIGANRIARFDHHLCHAAAAYLGAPFAGAPALVLTNDNSGDGLCATASTGRGVTLTRREATPSAPGSIGAFYSLVTLLLGMKPGEHEFKVMGLSAYAPGPARGPAAAALRSVFDFVEGEPCRFAWQRRGPRYRLLLEATLGMRFDGIAGGAQQILEESLVRWAGLMHERHGC